MVTSELPGRPATYTININTFKALARSKRSAYFTFTLSPYLLVTQIVLDTPQYDFAHVKFVVNDHIAD